MNVLESHPREVLGNEAGSSGIVQKNSVSLTNSVGYLAVTLLK